MELYNETLQICRQLKVTYCEGEQLPCPSQFLTYLPSVYLKKCLWTCSSYN